MKALIAGVLLLSLAACSGGGLTGPAGSTNVDGTWNPQAYAGCNHARADLNSDGNDDFFLIGCKEQETIEIEVTFDDRGKPVAVEYSASGVKALPAFESRADVEKWVAEKHGVAVEALTPAMTSIVEALLEVFVPVP